MRGKIILLFILALIALVLIGYLGQMGLREMIVSIEEASEPNPRIAGLGDILQDLSDAESSVRAFIITRDQETLDPFKQSAATIDTKLAQLKEITSQRSQLVRLEQLDTLITRKYETLSSLIDVRRDEDGNVLNKVMDDIEKLKTDAEVEEERDPTRTQQNDPQVFEKLFGEEPSREDSSEMAPNISTRELDEAIVRIGQEERNTSRQLMARELQLTQQDNAIMMRIRDVMRQIEQVENQRSSSRAQRVKSASEKTINTIFTTMVITLIVFAFMLSVIFNDIRRSRLNRQRLKEAKDRAEQLARVKQDFLSNMSHEIRTPLNAIIGFAEQLENSPLDARQASHLKRIRNSGDHLLRLINDILDYAKMESGKMELEQTGFRPEEEIREILALFESAAARKNISLANAIEENVPDILIGDSVRFRQILINLVNNALKFTDTGGIQISLQAMSSPSDDHSKILLAVEDTGIGIPENKLSSIFEDFAQADSSTARKYGGSGLGLSIVNKIAHLHKGDVKVSSQVGKGTRFEVTLIYKVGSEADLPVAETRATGEVSGMNVLIVDDQVYNLELLQSIFENWRVTYDACENGEQALQYLEKNSYDAILLDIQMPGISGYEVARQYRSMEPSDRHTPIIALTAGTSDNDRKQAEASGMDHFLSKPFTQEKLRRTLLHAVGKPVASATPLEPEATQGVNLDGLMELANGDMEFVTNMLTIFKNNFHSDLENLSEAVTENNLKKARSMAHKMVPPCGHLGFVKMVGLLRSMEKAAEEGDPEDILPGLLQEVKGRSLEIKLEIEKKINEIDQNKARV